MLSWLYFNIPTVNLLYAVGGLALLAIAICLWIDYMFRGQRLYLRFVASYVWTLLLLVIVGGTASTLLYSEVFGFVPCSLCWLQRVALYPQALLVLAAWRLKDAVYFPVYGIMLSLFGLAVALYQYVYQLLPAEVLQSGLLPCLADGSADCGKKVMEVFGFVTFPLLSAFTFVFLIVLYMHLRKQALNK